MDEKNMRAAEQPSGQNPPQGEEKAEKGRLFEAGLTYTVTAVLPVLVSFLLSVLLSVSGVVDPSGENWYRYLSFLLPQLCFLAAAAVYFARTREPVLRTVGKCRWQYYLLAVLIQFGLLSLSELNTFFLWLLSFFGYEQTPVSLPDLTGWNILPALLVIAVLKNYAAELGVRKVSVGQKGGALEFPDLATLSDRRIVAALERFNGHVSLDMTRAPVVRFPAQADGGRTMVQMTKFLKFAATFA